MTTRRGEDSSDEPTRFTWTCPICDATRVGSTTDRAVVARATATIENHVRSSLEDGHGPRHALPDEFDPDALDEYVDVIEGETDHSGGLSVEET